MAELLLALAYLALPWISAPAGPGRQPSASSVLVAIIPSRLGRGSACDTTAPLAQGCACLPCAGGACSSMHGSPALLLQPCAQPGSWRAPPRTLHPHAGSLSALDTSRLGWYPGAAPVTHMPSVSQCQPAARSSGQGGGGQPCMEPPVLSWFGVESPSPAIKPTLLGLKHLPSRPQPATYALPLGSATGHPQLHLPRASVCGGGM